MKKELTLFVLILLFNPTSINAQKLTISGKVESSNRVPVELANITLISPDSIFAGGSATNTNGEFKIEIKNRGNYFLTISYLGFENAIIQLNDVEKSMHIGTVYLEEAGELLDEVSVIARQQINKYDKSLLFPTENQKKHAANGYELLNNLMIPQVDIDILTKEVTTRGNKVTLLVNGKPITNKNEITALHPKDIVRVEYHDMPTGIFAEYEAVANFITRQYNYGGYIGLNGMQQTSYGNGDYLVMTRMNHKNSEYSLGYSFDYLHDNQKYRDTEEKFIYPGNDILYRKETGMPSLDKNHSHNVFFNYNLRKNANQTNIKAGYKVKQAPDNTILSLLEYNGTTDFTKNLEDINSEKQYNPYFSFYSNFKVKHNQTFYIRGSAEYSSNHYNRFYRETALSTPPDLFHSKVKENYYHTILNTSYTKELENGKSISASASNYTNISDSDYKNQNKSKERLVSSEFIYFINLAKKWNKFYFSLRIGGSSQLHRQREKKDKQYWSYRPGVTLKYLPNENNTVQYRVTLNNTFPVLSLFTDTEQSIDFIQKQKGNPALKIVNILNNRIAWTYSSNRYHFNFTFDHYHSFPGVKKQVEYDGTYFIHSYVNNGTYNLMSPGIGATIKLFNNKLNIKLNGGLNQFLITGYNNTKESDWYINPSIMVVYKNLNLNLYYSSSRRGLYASLEKWSTSEKYGLTLSYHNNGALLTLGTQNPFSGYVRKTRTELGIYSSNNYYHNSRNDHLFYIKLGYHFSYGKKHKYSNIDHIKTTRTAIIKGLKD